MALCALDGCDNKAAKLSKYCSQVCAEKEISKLRKAMGPRRRFSPEDLEASGYSGEASPAGLRALRNPFAEKSAAHIAFGLFRESGLHGGLHREEIIRFLEERCSDTGIPLSAPRERVRRVMTEIRAMGFELLKDDAGRFRLTGRRVN